MRIAAVLALTLMSSASIRATLIVNPAFANQFQTSTVVSGLNYPLGLTQLSDGSLLFGTTIPATGSGGTGQFAFYLGAGEVRRYVGGATTVIASNFPGAVTGVHALDNNLILVSTMGNQTASGFKMADLIFLKGSGNSYSKVGSVHFQYQPGGDAATLQPGVIQISPGTYKIVFGLEALGNDGTPGGPVTLTGLISAQLPAGSVDSLTVSTGGSTPTVEDPTQLASGIRNITNPVVDQSGNVFFGDNNYDVMGVPVNADELNRIAPDLPGVPFYGYPGNYTQYGTGVIIGGEGVQPLVAFQPSSKFASAGISSLALAPSGFTSGFNTGFFVGFHGAYTSGGVANVTDPLAYVSPEGSYIEFLEAGQPGLSHPDSLLSTTDSLYLANLFTGNFDAGTGEVDVITAVPEPSLMWLSIGVIALLVLNKRARLSCSR